jgi:hypothetical protein
MKNERFSSLMAASDIIALATILIGVAATSSTRAIAPVSTTSYGLELRHTVASEVVLQDGTPGLHVRLTIANNGGHPLFDLRLIPLRAGTAMVDAKRSPSSVRALLIGEQKDIDYTFTLARAAHLSGETHLVLFRIEAVDALAQEQITFNQKSS